MGAKNTKNLPPDDGVLQSLMAATVKERQSQRMPPALA